ncbi:hypothetical protein LTR70_007687 [Exophiala xenobiotica]|nr:hypothetical protein LTR70_007687 [Exophiala xenobiotica]
MASAPKKSKFKKQGKCRIVHRILDGADHERPCPRQLASDPVDEPTTDAAVDTSEAIEQDTAMLKPSSTRESGQALRPGVDGGFDPRYEALAWAIGKLIKQQGAWAATTSK